MFKHHIYFNLYFTWSPLQSFCGMSCNTLPLSFSLGEHCMTSQTMAAKETIFHLLPIKREIYNSHLTLPFCKIHASCNNFVLINASCINPLVPSLNLALKFGSCKCFLVLILKLNCTAFTPYQVHPFEFAPTLCHVRPHTFRVRPHQVEFAP